MGILIFFISIAVVYLLAVQGRSGHPGWEKLTGWYYAHRGLHGDGLPENSLGAFQAAVDAGYGSELDVHLLADGNLAVIHDSKLVRTTGAEGRIEDLTVDQLSQYKLEGTEEGIPTLQQVLDLYQGKAPLIVELKAERNVDELCERTCQVLDGYQGAYCIESFDPRCIIWLRKHRPDIIRGQLAHNTLRKKNNVPVVLKFILSFNLENFLARPDFIAYHFGTRRNLSNWLCRKLWGVRGVSWTLTRQEEFDIAIKEGWIPIFEGFRP